MRIVQLTPGAGGMYCGNCLRDNALVAAMRRHGHAVTMLPLYLPLKTDEADQSAGAPVFFGGINVYLAQKVPVFRRLPKWIHRMLDSPRLLKLVGTAAARTQPSEVGDLTVSMLRGESGNQAREVDELVNWLQQQPHPDVINLSNALLIGCARRLKSALGSIISVTLQGEDSFLDALPGEERQRAWDLVAERVAEADVIISPSRYYADRMAGRLNLPPERIQVVPNGLHLAGWRPAEQPPQPPALGFLARMCPEKGLDLLVDAFIQIRRGGRVPNLRLRIAGGLGPSDQAFVDAQKRRLHAEGLLGDVEFHPNLDRAAKQEFLRGLSVFSVPAHYGEAFGLYLLEAMAAGIPLVQPATGAFPEIIKASGAGLITRAADTADLARGIEEILLNPQLAEQFRRAARTAVETTYNIDSMAHQLVQLYLNCREPHSPAVAYS